MTRACSLVLLAAVMVLRAVAADWLSADGDPDHTRWQKAEQELTPANVGDLKLLWKREFDDRLSAPVALGPIYTHRGVKELVFVADAADHLFAIDSDLNRLFWQRHFTSQPAAHCGPPSAPVIAPATSPARKSDDPSSPNRPIYALSSDGRLQAIRPTDGADIRPAQPFAASGTNPGNLNLVKGVVKAGAKAGCNGSQPGGGKAATWTDASGTGWTYVPAPDSIRAFHSGNRPVWTSQEIAAPESPVIANGIVFTVSGTTLIALDALTGKELFRGGPAGQATETTDSLAIANGHVFFVNGKTLYCFGFPIEI